MCVCVVCFKLNACENLMCRRCCRRFCRRRRRPHISMYDIRMLICTRFMNGNMKMLACLHGGQYAMRTPTSTRSEYVNMRFVQRQNPGPCDGGETNRASERYADPEKDYRLCVSVRASMHILYYMYIVFEWLRNQCVIQSMKHKHTKWRVFWNTCSLVEIICEMRQHNTGLRFNDPKTCYPLDLSLKYLCVHDDLSVKMPRMLLCNARYSIFNSIYVIFLLTR